MTGWSSFWDAYRRSKQDRAEVDSIKVNMEIPKDTLEETPASSEETEKTRKNKRKEKTMTKLPEEDIAWANDFDETLTVLMSAIFP